MWWTCSSRRDYLMHTPLQTPIKPKPNEGYPLQDQSKYRKRVGRLIYLIVTRPNLSFAISIVSQFTQDPRTIHWKAAVRTLRYLKKHELMEVQNFVDLDRAGYHHRQSTSENCIMMGRNVVVWKRNKMLQQDLVLKPSKKAIAKAPTKLVWMKMLLKS